MREIESVLNRLRPTIEAVGGGNYEGEDLFEDVALACLNKENDYDWKHPQIDGRVMRIARNLHVRRIRRERVRECCGLPNEDLLQDHDFSSIDKQLERQEQAVLCRRVIQQLAPRERAIVWWHVVRGVRFGRIACLLHLNESTVRSCCHRALQKIKLDPAILVLASHLR